MKTRPARRGQRHPIAVDVEVTNLELGIQIKERTKDLSLYGCGLSTATPFSAGTKVMLKVTVVPFISPVHRDQLWRRSILHRRSIHDHWRTFT